MYKDSSLSHGAPRSPSSDVHLVLFMGMSTTVGLSSSSGTYLVEGNIVLNVGGLLLRIRIVPMA